MQTTHIDSQYAALIIVDVQNDYCHEKGYFGLKGKDLSREHAIVPVIERLIEQARKSGVPIVFVKKTVSDSDFLSEEWKNRPNAIRKDATIVKRGTWGAEFYKLVPETEDIIIEKHRYSAFDKTNLDEILRKLQRKSLVIVGLATNICVESTARHGFALDYNVTLVRDGCASYDSELELATFRNIESFFGWVMDSEDILKHWEIGAMS